jgi:hypothetical protein
MVRARNSEQQAGYRLSNLFEQILLPEDDATIVFFVIVST